MRLTKKTENERMWNGHQTSTISLPTTSAKRKDSSTNEEHNNIKYTHTYNSISYQKLQLFQEKVKPKK